MLIYTPIPRHQAILFTSPKCACQTIEKINLRIFKHPFFNTFQIGTPYANKEGNNSYEYNQKNFEKILKNGKDFSKIVVTRNPVKRILSCYNYMIVGKHRYTYLRPTGKTWFKDRIEAYTKKPLFETTFTELVDYTLETPDHLLDIHLSPQTFCAENLNPTHIVRVENLNSDLQEISDELKLGLAVPTHIQKNKTNYNFVNPSEITDELLSKIFEIYKEDFKKFKHDLPSVKSMKKYLEKKSHKGRVHCRPIIPQHSNIIQ
tara:strand:- start:1531 stop:2313 length:783 start_codon:yes stop_codon:yes gene_type:complete